MDNNAELVRKIMKNLHRLQDIFFDSLCIDLMKYSNKSVGICIMYESYKGNTAKVFNFNYWDDKQTIMREYNSLLNYGIIRPSISKDFQSFIIE